MLHVLPQVRNSVESRSRAFMNFLYAPDGLKITVKAFLHEGSPARSESFPVESKFCAAGFIPISLKRASRILKAIWDNVCSASLRSAEE